MSQTTVAARKKAERYVVRSAMQWWRAVNSYGPNYEANREKAISRLASAAFRLASIRQGRDGTVIVGRWP